MDGVAGLLLAAGAGRRMGLPKALVREPDGQAWVTRSVLALAAGGCEPVLVVVGARATEVAALVPASAPMQISVHVVTATDWDEGMGASLRAGLRALAGLAGPDVVAAVVGLVDTPGVGPAVIARLIAHARPASSTESAGSAGSAPSTESAGPAVLARAAYNGVPGHPVLLGREHWAAVAEQARGDAGARGYLAGREVSRVECGDVGDGRDFDVR